MERDRVRERERQGVSKGRDGGEDATDCVLGMLSCFAIGSFTHPQAKWKARDCDHNCIFPRICLSCITYRM